MTVILGQKVALLLCFYPFGNDIKAKAMRQGHDSAGNGCVIGVADYIADEGLVDL